MQRHVGIARGYLRNNIPKPLLGSGRLRMAIPDKPTSRNRRYVATAETGLEDG